jgi:hypothetical protein
MPFFFGAQNNYLAARIRAADGFYLFVIICFFDLSRERAMSLPGARLRR